MPAFARSDQPRAERPTGHRLIAASGGSRTEPPELPISPFLNTDPVL
jgi:hypothetical protein